MEIGLWPDRKRIYRKIEAHPPQTMFRGPNKSCSPYEVCQSIWYDPPQCPYGSRPAPPNPEGKYCVPGFSYLGFSGALSHVLEYKMWIRGCCDNDCDGERGCTFGPWVYIGRLTPTWGCCN